MIEYVFATFKLDCPVCGHRINEIAKPTFHKKSGQKVTCGWCSLQFHVKDDSKGN